MVLVRLLTFSVFCFVCVCCSKNKLLFRRQSFNYEMIGNQEFENCHARNFSQALKSNMNYFKCLPREAIVHLYSHELNVEMIPNKVVVKRCYESGCYGMNSCLPSKTREVKVAVRLNYRVEQKQRCSWVTVTEHTQCRCGCKVTRQQCEKANKEFSARECTCKCKNEAERKDCIKQENMEWNEETCSCMCPTSFMECSTGATWVPQFCKCMQVMSNENMVFHAR